jgi:hypothetical protein
MFEVSERDVQLTVILETLGEILARLKLLDDTQVRLEATVEQQLVLLSLIARQERAQLQANSATTEDPLGLVQVDEQEPAGNRSHSDDGLDMRVNQIRDHDTEYSKETHPALFKVVDLLQRDERLRTLSVRQLAQVTGISKSWCAIAKRYVLREESVH